MFAWLWLLTSSALAAGDCPGLSGKALSGTPGQRKIALVVGVGDYRATIDGKPIDLVGPPNDARRVRDTLQRVYGFPAENVCLLLDADATRANLDAAWAKHLERAQSGDTVVYYFSGHGSQTTDFDGPQDETDGLDETSLLHDSRTPNGGSELLDDELNVMLGRLYAKTQNVTVIVDSCHSGTATRGDPAVQRAVEPLARTGPAPSLRPAGTSGDYVPGRFEKLVFLSAARDGTVALERNGQGLFTNALLQGLESAPNRSWDELSRAIPRMVAAQRSNQVPSFEGQLERQAFGTAVVGRPLSWPVVAVQGETVQFRGPALPGWTPGAVVELFSGDVTKSKGSVVLTKVEPMRAEGRLRSPPSSAVRVDDYGRLATPGPESFAITVRFAPGLPLAADIARSIEDVDVLKRTVKKVDGPADFELRAGPTGTVEIWGGEGVRRNRLSAKTAQDASDIAWALGLHARQASLLALTNETTTTYPQDTMLKVRILPTPNQQGCPREPFVAPPIPMSYVEVPMCNPIQLDVELTIEPQAPLNIGVLYLASDGTIVAYPQGNTIEVLRHRGEHYVVPLGFVAPPLESPDRIVVFGTHDQVAWSQLQATAPPMVTRGSGLQGFVNDNVSGTRATRGTTKEPEDPNRGVGWTASFVQLQVAANPGQWSASERTDPGVCAARRKVHETSGSCPK